MPNKNEIKSMAYSVQSNRSSVSNKNNIYNGFASSLSSNWKGEIGDAFKDANKRLKTKMSNITSAYTTLNSKLGLLANSVQKAENEEKKAATAVQGKR